jgi:predicted nucleotidyltransferase component of viral defense system
VIDRREILSAAGNLGLLPGTVEKDYVLGWLLAGICNHPTIADKWVFKGGKERVLLTKPFHHNMRLN